MAIGNAEANITYVSDLFKGCKIELTVPNPDIPQNSMWPSGSTSGEIREKLLERIQGSASATMVLMAFADAFRNTEHEPIYRIGPGTEEFTWPHDTPNAMVMTINGVDISTEDMYGAAFVFPIHIQQEKGYSTLPAFGTQVMSARDIIRNAVKSYKEPKTVRIP